MKSYKLEVDIKDDDGDSIATGHIMIKVPSVKERIEAMKDMGLTADDLQNPIAQITKMVPALDQFVEGIEIKAGGQDFTELEDLSYYDAFNSVFPDILSILMNGIPLGKN